MAKFKEGDLVYHVSGSHAYKQEIVKVLPPKTVLGFPLEQRYILKGASAAASMLSAFGNPDDVASESDLVSRNPADKKTSKTKLPKARPTRSVKRS